MRRGSRLGLWLWSLAMTTSLGLSLAARADLAVVAGDDTIRVVDGEIVIDPEGQQTLSFIDLMGEAPRLVSSIDVGNSLFGPPVNVAITPDRKIALLSQALKVGETDNGPGLVPSNLVQVLDLEAEPPMVIDRVEVGLQPSGLSIHPDGTAALVATVAGQAVVVLQIDGKDVSVAGKVDLGGDVTHVAFTPDGKQALATKFEDHFVAILDVDGTEVVHREPDIPVGLYPFNLAISPDGGLAIVANAGKGGRSDGHVDTVTVIDLDAEPPRIIDHITVGEAPEGIAFSPDGAIAVVGLLDGGDSPLDAHEYRSQGRIVVLGIDGKRVTEIEKISLGGIPESLAFSPDGRWLLVGNLLDKTISVLEVSGRKVRKTERTIPLPTQPSALRAQ
ncbi:MAG: YncE family protein [Geminicoccaceae bacterium]